MEAADAEEVLVDEVFPAAAERTLVGSALATCVDGADVDELVCTVVDVPDDTAVEELVCATIGVPEEAGVGGASIRMNAAKFTMSDE